MHARGLAYKNVYRVVVIGGVRKIKKRTLFMGIRRRWWWQEAKG